MSSDWRVVTVKDIAAPYPTALSTGPFGSAISSKYFLNSGVPVIRGSNLSADVSTRLIDDGLVFVSPEKAGEFQRSVVNRGDLIFTCWGTINQVGLIDSRSKFDSYIISNKQMKLSVDPAKADQRFIYYVFSGPEKQAEILDNGIGSSVPGFNLGQLKHHEILLPPLGEQTRIADCLEMLDDRITLLRETNATLEAIAQALFKSWFVDFDPVRAKMEGRAPDGMDEATAALFPDAFDQTESGVVPRGWRVGSLSELIRLHKGSVNPGVQPDTEFQHFSLPAFDAGQMPQAEFGSEIKSNKTLVPEDGILLSKLNPHIPRIWLPSAVGSHAVCSTEFLPFVPTGSSTTAFVYCMLSAPDFSKNICQLVTGTSNSHQRIKPDGVLSMQYVIPPAGVIASFDGVAISLLERLKANRIEAQSLSDLRDTLLPRLISGHLRLPEAETALTAA